MLGLIIILLSGLLVFCNNGSMGSIIASTLLLIESLVVIDHSFTSAEEENAVAIWLHGRNTTGSSAFFCILPLC